MTLGPFLTNVVSGIVKEETVPFMDLKRAGTVLLGKTGKKGTVSKILKVVRREAHCLETLGHFVPAGRKSPFRFVKQGYKEPLHKAIKNAVEEKVRPKPEKKETGKRSRSESVPPEPMPVPIPEPSPAFRPEPSPALRPEPSPIDGRDLVTVLSSDSVSRSRYRGGDFALACAELESMRLPDPDEELARLYRDPKVNVVLTRVAGAEYPKEHLIALGHVVERREKFKETHYVLTHGQNAKFMIFNLIARRLQEFMKAAPVIGGIPLRHPCFTGHIRSDQTPEWFRHECDRLARGDHAFRDELVCADAYLASTAGAESANDFVEHANIGLGEGDIRRVIERQLRDCFPDRDINPLLNVFMRMYNEVSASLVNKGNLYAICIPKDKLSQMAYPSGPFGKTHVACRDKSVDEVVGQLQSDDLTGFSSYAIPQIRLLTHKLTPEEDVQIFQESTLPEDFVSRTDGMTYRAIARFIVGDNPEEVLEEPPRL